MNPDIFDSDDVANSCPVSYRIINRYGTTATTGQICRHYRVLYGACSEHILLQSSPGCYSESGYHRMLIRYVWTGKFLNPERKSCGFKNIRIRVDGAFIWTRQSVSNVDVDIFFRRGDFEY